QALRNKGLTVIDEGYRVAYALAEDNLRLGRIVIADSVNPIQVTRDAWSEVARRAGTRHVDVEFVCSNRDEHRRRIERRQSDITGHQLPTWAEVTSREYHRWDCDHILIDTSHTTEHAAVARICSTLS
ncbi:MAG: hypothetical protein K8S25_16115, partial [Alphaproteobacteria bacterium]|nr:hypothetical protein [Alphaproteobacteria bacterium]